jgi:hypothetical protein
MRFTFSLRSTLLIVALFALAFMGVRWWRRTAALEALRQWTKVGFGIRYSALRGPNPSGDLRLRIRRFALRSPAPVEDASGGVSTGDQDFLVGLTPIHVSETLLFQVAAPALEQHVTLESSFDENGPVLGISSNGRYAVVPLPGDVYSVVSHSEPFGLDFYPDETSRFATSSWDGHDYYECELVFVADPPASGPATSADSVH